MSNDSNAGYMETNRRHWDEAVQHHVASEFYDVASFAAGRSSLLPIEREETGDVRGKTLLHLQCHFGMDTLSWAREGATVTGIDFSPNAIEAARRLASATGIDATFIESNLYDLPRVLAGQFDVVFTSYGTIVWLPDIDEWARIAASYVKPGSFFYIVDGHPFYSMIWDSTEDEIRVRHGYFPAEPVAEHDEGTYATAARLKNEATYNFNHPLGSVITALVAAGLRIEYVHEFPMGAWRALPGMTKGDDGLWRLPPASPQVPLIFSIRATKP